MYCISVNYKNSDVNIRKKLAFSESVQKNFLAEFITDENVSECLIVCTCNRTELYFCGNEQSVSIAENLLSRYCGIDCDLLKKHLYLFYADKAVCHLFRVASGIESMVIGEDEILGQIKLAYTSAKDMGMTGYELNMTFQSAMACAKKIKTQTALSKTSVSTATLAGNEIAHFKDRVNVLVIGATGKIGTTLVKNLLSYKNVTVTATSRKHKAQTVQNRQSIAIADYADRYSYIDSADCVVSATASPHYTITYYDLKQSIKTDKPRLFIDLAVPPDIDSTVEQIKDLRLIGIDYFEKLAKGNNELKLDSVESAKEIIREECDVLKKDIAFHNFLPYMQTVKNKLSENSLEEIIYKFKANLPSDEFIKILDAFKSCGEKI
ncbi:glutamyl-tRNA reductase [Ruminococcus sp.]|uniref:glutamyl-tRNA reductase n=1 Tax=Ruminococcus sp. TaxID=41978 RepID=UPI0038649E1C